MNKTFIIHNYNVKQEVKRKFKHSLCTIIQVTLVAGLPTPLSAVHLQPPSSCLLMLIKDLGTVMLSESLVQVMFGAGYPLAVQMRVTLLPSVTVWLVEISMIFGGTATILEKEKKIQSKISLLDYLFCFASFVWILVFLFIILF